MVRWLSRPKDYAVGLVTPQAAKYYRGMRGWLSMCCALSVAGLVPLYGGRAQGDEPVAKAHVSALGGMIKRDAVIGADAFFDFGHRGFRLTLGAPLRFVPASGLRREDWDERTDYGRVVREVSLSQPDHGVHLRVAPLTGFHLGVGHLVSLFYSTLDVDHWRTGFEGVWQSTAGGLGLFVDSVLDPEVLGGRLYVRPFSFLQPDGLFGRFEFGGTMVGDIQAPSEYVLDRGKRTLDNTGLPRVARKTVSAVGFDARWPILRVSEAEVVPYFAMAQAAEGSGWHAGLALHLRPGRKVQFGLQAEFRRLGSGYIAAYFDSLYMVDRWDFGNAPKASAVRSSDIPRRYGFASGLTIAKDEVFEGFVLLDLDGEGRFTTLRVGANVLVARGILFGFAYLSRGIPHFSRLVTPDRAVFATFCDFAISRFFSAFASYGRDPSVRRSGPNVGGYGSSDTLLVGLRLSFGSR